MADERGMLRLERISRHYDSLGDYTLSFKIKAGESEQSGELGVQGQNLYMHLADTEVYVADSVRYEVRRGAKEIVVDKSELYEQELLSTLNGLVNVGKDMIKVWVLATEIISFWIPENQSEQNREYSGNSQCSARVKSIDTIHGSHDCQHDDSGVDHSHRVFQSIPVYSNE
jgi:hypothetical protein